MIVEPRLICKIATHTPKKTVVDSSGKTVLVMPEGDIHTYLTFDDGERVRAYYLNVEHLHGLTLALYTPLETATSVFRSKEGTVAVVSEEVKYEEY